MPSKSSKNYYQRKQLIILIKTYIAEAPYKETTRDPHIFSA